MTTLEIGNVPFSARTREHRESYTDLKVQAAESTASGTAASAAVAAVEAALGLWERGFASARSLSMKPWQLALAARSLLLRGESLWWIARDSRLLPVASHDIAGKSASPDRWTYRITLPTPGGGITKPASAGNIVHFRLGVDRSAPWRGCSPLANASATRGLLERIEKSLTDEHKVPAVRVVGVANPEESQDIANSIAAGGGRVLLGENSDSGVPEGRNAGSTWSPDRFGPEPEVSSVALRSDVERSILSAAGVPSELVIPSSGGGDARESWRRFLYATIAPIGALMSSELSRVGLDSAIHFDELRASDLAGRARAFKQLTEADMDPAEARRVTGFD